MSRRKEGGFYQDTYQVINKEKYIGTKPPFYRSSWERRFMYHCDFNKNVLRWGSEIIVIPYFFDLDGKTHRYYTDFYMEVITAKGEKKKYVIEIKPSDQTPFNIPKPPKKKTAKALKNYRNKMITIKKNDCKWKAANQFCKKHGYEFKIITEKELF